MTTILETVHGSRLYGLTHPGSDLDVYRVVPSWNRARKHDVRQTVRDGVDTTVIGLSTFMHMCEQGVPQALEAMFSPVATVDRMAELREGYRVGWMMRKTYMRTATNFINGDTEKKRRHACRLVLNLREAERTGRFNPMLDAETLRVLENWSGMYGVLYEVLMEARW